MPLGHKLPNSAVCSSPGQRFSHLQGALGSRQRHALLVCELVLAPLRARVLQARQ